MLHCIHVLGLIPGANAGRVLLEALRLRDEDHEDYLWEWLAGSWPALFANKLDHVRAELREIAANRTRLAPVETIVREGPKIGRNDPCPCPCGSGSGRKYKKCCLAR